MFSRNLFVLDFVKRFFVSCIQISEAYGVRMLMKSSATDGKSAAKASTWKTPKGHISCHNIFFIFTTSCLKIPSSFYAVDL